jgi:hypothetical protein
MMPATLTEPELIALATTQLAIYTGSTNPDVRHAVMQRTVALTSELLQRAKDAMVKEASR